MEVKEAIEMVSALERYREDQAKKTRALQEAARLARAGERAEAQRIKGQVDSSPTVFSGDVLEAMRAMKKHIAALEGGE